MSQPLELKIEKAVYGGAGLGRHEGKAVFVPLTLPSELVTVAVTKDKGSFAEASLVKVLEASAQRATPPCPYFGICGGCHYQHAWYLAQVEMKSTILEETLARASIGSLPPITIHTGAPLGYRNRIRLHLDPRTSALGYRERGSLRLLPVELCPIATPALNAVMGVLGPLCVEQECGRQFAEVELSVNDEGSAILLALWLRSGVGDADAAGYLRRLCEALQTVVPALRGAGVHSAPASSAKDGRRAARGRQGTARDGVLDGSAGQQEQGTLVARWGTLQMSYRAAGLAYQVSLGAFFQVNHALVDRLVEVAVGGASGKLAWDLYAGVGLFSRVLAKRFEQVVAVEGSPVSSADLRVNLTRPHRVVESRTVDFLRREAAVVRRPDGGSAGRTPDLVLVDPPRSGLGGEVTRLLGELRPKAITYVSCDPATLARDLHALIKSGYQLRQLHMIDLFPQTFHLEAVAMLWLG